MSRYKEIITRAVVSSTLKRRAKEYFLGLKRLKWASGYRSGRLDTTRLVGIVNGRRDVFKKREDVKMVNAAVSLLVDASGSMSGECYALACASAVTMAESLSAIGVSIEVAGFTDWTEEQLGHEIFCPFGSRFNASSVIDKMDDLGSYLCNNSDGENIMIAYDRLLQQKVDKRILIVLSDGGPSSCLRGVSDDELLKTVSNFVHHDGKKTNTQLWGVGIGRSNAVKMYYDNTVIVKDDKDIGEALFTLIKQAIVIKHT